MKISNLLLTILAATFMCQAANAATVTLDFTGGEDLSGGLAPWQVREEGFVYTHDPIYLSGNHLYLHDDSGTVSTAITPDAPVHFDLLSADFRGISRLYKVNAKGEAKHVPWKFKNAVVQGYRDGALVAESSFRARTNTKTKNFSSAFTNLDQLIVSYVLPTGAIKELYGRLFVGSTQLAKGLYCDEYCGGLIADNFELNVYPTEIITAAKPIAPVPLPASFLMLLAGLGALVFARRRA